MCAGELLEADWQRQCALLVMPGGADLPYAKHLNGQGNHLISGGGEGIACGSVPSPREPPSPAMLS